MTFEEILDKRSSDIRQLKALPQGTYRAIVKGCPTFNPVGANQTPAVNFKLTGFVPVGYIDPDVLAECENIADRELTLNLFLTEAAMWRLKQFLDHLGIEEGDRTLRERLADAPNRPVIVTITHSTGRNSEQIFANVTSIAKAETC
jgi:hypothetical protein